MECILRKFLSLRIEKMRCIDNGDAPDAPKSMEKVDQGVSSGVQGRQGELSARQEMVAFLKWAMDIDIDVGLQAYRLLSALMHRRLVKTFSEALTVSFTVSCVSIIWLLLF